MVINDSITAHWGSEHARITSYSRRWEEAQPESCHRGEVSLTDWLVCADSLFFVFFLHISTFSYSFLIYCKINDKIVISYGYVFLFVFNVIENISYAGIINHCT